MKNLKIIFWIFLLLAFGATLFAASEQKREGELSQTTFIQGEGSEWVVLVKEIGNQRFICKFPERPSLEDVGEHTFRFEANQGNQKYQISVEPIASGQSLENWMQNTLKELIDHPSTELLNFFVGRAEHGPFMEMTYIRDSQVVREKKFHYSGQIFSLASKGSYAGEDRFFDSFEIFEMDV